MPSAAHSTFGAPVRGGVRVTPLGLACAALPTGQLGGHQSVGYTDLDPAGLYGPNLVHRIVSAVSHHPHRTFTAGLLTGLGNDFQRSVIIGGLMQLSAPQSGDRPTRPFRGAADFPRNNGTPDLCECAVPAAATRSSPARRRTTKLSTVTAADSLPALSYCTALRPIHL